MWYSISGILLVFIGTALSLWSILNQNLEAVGSWKGAEIAAKEAPIQKKLVRIGIIIIAIGSILQIIGILYP